MPLHINVAKFLPEKVEKKLLNISSGYFYRQDMGKIKWRNICQNVDKLCQKIDGLLFPFID
jgi:hypothetical protein